MTDREHASSGWPGSTARAAVVAEAMVRAAWTDTLFAACGWIQAEGTGDGEEAHERMKRADDALEAARALRDRVSRGTATSHEIVRLLRSGAGFTKR